MSEPSFTVYVVDDDPAVLRGLTRLLRVSGYGVEAFSSPADFLARHDPAIPGCAVLDLSMPGIHGLEVQAELERSRDARPVIFLTGVGDVPTTVRAMRAGAIDFLTKPVNERDLLAVIARAEEEDTRSRLVRSGRASIDARLATLTPREREVLRHVVSGRLNKEIAAVLGTVEKTIKVHRGRMMAKLGARTVADLMRMMQIAGVGPIDETRPERTLDLRPTRQASLGG